MDRRAACVCVSATDEARCDSVHMPSVFAKTACQSDMAMWSERCQAGQLGSDGRRHENSLPCRPVIREGLPPGSQRQHDEAKLNAVQGVLPSI